MSDQDETGGEYARFVPSQFPSSDSMMVSPIGTPTRRKPMTVLKTPAEAFRHKHFIANYIISCVITFSINAGLAAAFLKGMDYMGLWSRPNSPDSNTTTVWADFFITGAIICFLTTLFATPTCRGDVKKGKVTPIADEHLGRGIYRFFPTRLNHTFLRALVYAAEFEVIFTIPTLMVMGLLCEGSALPRDNGHTCQLTISGYIWLKGCWAGTMCVLCYPMIYAGALNRTNIPDEIYDQFLGRTQPRELIDGADDEHNAAAEANGHV